MPDCLIGCVETGGVSVSDTSLVQWPLAEDMWRMSSKLELRYVNWFFKTVGLHRLPASVVSRLYTLGLPPETVYITLKSIRSLDEWSTEWVETAQQYLGTYRREISAGNIPEAERARYMAAMCYQAAQIMEYSDTKTRNNCRAWSANLARLSLPVRNPNARHFMIPWNDQELPVLFEVPEVGDGPFGLVVILNGVSLSKEETFNWSPRFLQAGFAVMAVDSPGTGEATSLGPISPHYTDILDGVFEMLRHEQAIDLNRVVLMGASLGGNEAIRIARRNADVMAVVAVTPAVEPTRWLPHASPMLKTELAEVAEPEHREELAGAFDVLGAAESSEQPMLIFGAGRDMVVPPNESQRLAEALGARSTFIWYPDLGHCLYAADDQWTWEAATWIRAVGEARVNGVSDPAELATIGQQAIEADTYRKFEEDVAEWEDDDIGEYARLITP